MLADAEHVVSLTLTFLHAALDHAGFPQRDTDLRHDEADGALRTGDAGYDRVGPAVLRRDDDTVGCGVTQCKLRGPRRVIDLQRDEDDIEIARQALCFVQVRGLGMSGEGIMRTADRDALPAERLHLFGPGVDQRDIVPRARQEGADVAADRSGTDEQNFLGHERLQLSGDRYYGSVEPWFAHEIEGSNERSVDFRDQTRCPTGRGTAARCQRSQPAGTPTLDRSRPSIATSRTIRRRW